MVRAGSGAPSAAPPRETKGWRLPGAPARRGPGRCGRGPASALTWAARPCRAGGAAGPCAAACSGARSARAAAAAPAAAGAAASASASRSVSHRGGQGRCQAAGEGPAEGRHLAPRGRRRRGHHSAGRGKEGRVSRGRGLTEGAWPVPAGAPIGY